ncbi:VOC family protein [Microcella humidisoli]|uniref:VOC family protein n=1 Tax=Microcella humidisoli TaxID=2963406 RepID=A0ABY5FYA5_9MICO|nr:VOC family protein [Microcella humidisoli]UTT62736.1 VOC family protein [Microcella humidisoli]
MVSINIVEIPARRLEQARDFYATVFAIELELTEVDGQRMVFFPNDDPAAAAIAITEGDDYRPSGEGIRLYITVDDVEAVLARAVAAGGEIAAEVDVVEGWGAYASFRDLEGTVIGITQPEPDAG